MSIKNSIAGLLKGIIPPPQFISDIMRAGGGREVTPTHNAETCWVGGLKPARSNGLCGQYPVILIPYFLISARGWAGGGYGGPPPASAAASGGGRRQRGFSSRPPRARKPFRWPHWSSLDAVWRSSEKKIFSGFDLCQAGVGVPFTIKKAADERIATGGRCVDDVEVDTPLREGRSGQGAGPPPILSPP